MTRIFLLVLIGLLAGMPLFGCQDRRADRAFNAGDYGKTAKELQSLAELGEARAQYDLALMYDQGLGVPQSDAQALKWYTRAAEQGDPRAEYNLGLMYMNGQGISPNLVQAHYWLSLSLAHGDTKAPAAREYVEGNMTPGQIEEAQKLARFRLEQGPGMPREVHHFSP